MEIQKPASDQQTDLLQFIFFNQRGFRPGWRLLIFVALYFTFQFASSVVLSPFARHLPSGLTPPALILGEALLLLSVLLASWIMSRIEQRDMGEYGLPLRNSGALPRFLRGYVFWGFLPLTLLLLALRAVRIFDFGNLALHNGRIFYWAAVWVLLFVLVGLYEEYAFRGYMLFTMTEGIGFWPAAVVTAATFAAVHLLVNGGENRIGIMTTAFFAMFTAIVLRYTGNLWLAVGAHAGWDWGQSYFYGVQNSGIKLPGHLLNSHTQGPPWLSGGSAGPEGSILCLALLVAMSVLFALLYRRARQPVLVVTRTW